MEKGEYATSCAIEARVEKVWAVLTDAEAYPEWNPEIVKLEGTLEEGGRIKAHVRLGDGALRKIGLRVTRLDAPRVMEWVGGLPLGLFVGRRTFTVAALPGGKSQFKLHLSMTGPMAGPILKSVGDRQPEIEGFARALKERVEGRGPPRRCAPPPRTVGARYSWSW